MSERSLSVNPIIEPFAAGVIGLGVGYILAPVKYSLEDVVTLKEDVFDKIYTKDLEKSMNSVERGALQNIKLVRKEYKTSKSGFVRDIKCKAKLWRDLFNKVEIPMHLQESYNVSRMNLQLAIKENNYVELNKQYRKVKAELKLSPNNEALKKALTEANSSLAKAKTILSPEIEIYKNLVTNISDIRLQKVKNDPIRYVNVKEAYHSFLKALSCRRTFISNKLYSIVNSEKIIESYKILNPYLPKARTKAALCGAGYAGAITALLMMLMLKPKKRKPHAVYC